MVMKKNAMRKNLTQSIRRSLGRYLAIVMIIALGASMFVGLLMTKSDMVATGQKYMDEQNMFDLRLMSTYGWSREQVAEIAAMEGIVDAEGVTYLDAIARLGDGEDAVYRLYAIPETVNQLSLRGGRMPEAANECLADGYHATSALLGKTITIAENNEESTLDALVYRTYTVVGYVASPLYMDMNRGTTSVGNGSLASYFFVPEEGLDVDYYAEIHVTIPGDHDVYTKAYNNAMEDMAELLEPQLEPLAQQRLEQVRTDAEAEYREGKAEFREGYQEFVEGRTEAKQELADALQKLEDAQAEIADNEALLLDGEKQLEEGKEALKDSEQLMRDSRQQLASARADAFAQLAEANAVLFDNYKTVNSSLKQVNSGLLQLESGRLQLTAGITQLESGLSQLDSGVKQIELLIGIMDASITTAQTALDIAKKAPEADLEKIAELEAKLQELVDKRDEYAAQRDELLAQRGPLQEQLDALYAQEAELDGKKEELEATKATLEEAMAAIDEGFLELQSNQTQVENQFAAAEAQLEAGQIQIESAYAEIEAREEELLEGKAELEKGKEELKEAWEEYYEGEAEADREIADALSELMDAQEELEDAWLTIEGMTETSVYILNRTSNIGYNSLDSASDIVQGVSRVFPAFFLLVAALVCITTMTRMIDEERTQIGTLKALGYSNGAIISKYMIYAGSGALLGCGLGVLVGSAAFPTILWQAYKIMLYITDGIVLQINWWLCGAVVFAYTVVMLLVTWYCCRRCLDEVPAELIRPKAPEAGKKILMEYLPFWKKISFLNKVTIRNIFRYRQRLAMMMVGIGGCTALLLTGYGLRDSIVNVVNYQFEEVTTYDMTVYFSGGRTEKQKNDFLAEVEGEAENVLFYHQSSIDLSTEDQTKEIYLIAAGDRVQEFIDFHASGRQLGMPGQDEILLSAGVAAALDIEAGDQVSLRNVDMQELNVTVAGVYENHVYNYAIVRPETIASQWGEYPEEQMAFIQTPEGKSVHEVSALITGLDDVMNISVSEDLADMVGNMMEALDLVVVVIVFCAALLAVIVLYNLTNININERIREIATIKVLGFRAGETAAYIFKENLTLSAIGSVFGLGLGYLLLLFVMSQIKIDMVWFKALAKPLSYVISIVLTMVAACVVDFVFYFKLEKINMAEALKSVE